MTAKEYLSQAKFLDTVINSHMREVEYWRELSMKLSGCTFEERISVSTPPTDASFVDCIAKMSEAMELVNEEISHLVSLRKEINSRIDMLDDHGEQLVLRYHYLSGCTLAEVSRIMSVSESTAKRIHRKALEHFPVPE